MDKHNTGRISQVLAVVVALFFFFFSFSGYQKTGDITLALMFGLLAVLGYFVVKLLFVGVNKLLDSLDRKADKS
ncbi:hypothetical protein [Amphritea sp.]|uniref:hypothetical protein n=1 Tax=Amphritea sp. TaxID=1872502 RepID=UPI0025C491EF|nr:hypothetical protein [Amphritea sp.]